MTDDERLAEWLVDWEESVEAGRQMDPAELCLDAPHLLPELLKRIALLGNMRWVDRLKRGSELAVGCEVVAGLKLISLLGRGGFGQVWKAERRDGNVVALKFLPSKEKAARDELRALSHLREVRHPNLLLLLETWELEDWLVLAYELADCTLEERWQAAGKEGLGYHEVVEHFRSAAAALDHLHRANIYHRDVKPQNLLLVGGVLKVADFGLVRPTQHTVTGHTGGLTVEYAAPEFFEGKTHRRSDQYSLAVTYCRVRGGRLPFGGTPVQVMAGHLSFPPDLTMLPETERPQVRRALSKAPGDRWPTCGEFVEALSKAPGGLPRRMVTHESQTLPSTMLLPLMDSLRSTVEVCRNGRPDKVVEELEKALNYANGIPCTPYVRGCLGELRAGRTTAARVNWDGLPGRPCLVAAVFRAVIGFVCHEGSDFAGATADYDATIRELRDFETNTLEIFARQVMPGSSYPIAALRDYLNPIIEEMLKSFRIMQDFAKDNHRISMRWERGRLIREAKLRYKERQ